MHIKRRVVLLLVSIIIFSGCSTSSKNSKDSSFPELTATGSSTPVNGPPVLLETDFTARFEIYTNGTKRIFTDTKYHRQSAEVYIENPDPHIIQVKKPNLTWNDFFTTLPFTLEKNCLVTGTKQTFCNTETKRLYFYLNDQEDPDALDTVISPNDELRVEYR